MREGESLCTGLRTTKIQNKIAVSDLALRHPSVPPRGARIQLFPLGWVEPHPKSGECCSPGSIPRRPSCRGSLWSAPHQRSSSQWLGSGSGPCLTIFSHNNTGGGFDIGLGGGSGRPSHLNRPGKHLIIFSCKVEKGYS
jgi:hypothetical protein